MRARLCAALIGAVAVGFVPAAPASATCNAALYIATGACANECTLVRDAYYAARAASGDVLPYIPFQCPA